jgi:hypothetical protein
MEKTAQKSCSSHGIVTTCFWAVNVSIAVFPSLTQICCSIRKSWMTRNTHNNKHPVRSNAKNYVYKLGKMIQKRAVLQHLVAKSCTACCCKFWQWVRALLDMPLCLSIHQLRH